MSGNAQSPAKENAASKDLVNKDGTVTKLVELATADVNSVEDLIGVFGDQGVVYSKGEEVTGDYRLVTGAEKQLFLEKVQGARVGVVKWNFINNPGQREFVAVHVIIDGFGKFILNDSSQGGFYGQLSKITTKRLESDVPWDRAHTGLIAEGGFKKNNEFYFRTACPTHKDGKGSNCDICARIGKAIPRSEVDDVPAAQKEKARPTWSLIFQ